MIGISDFEASVKKLVSACRALGIKRTGERQEPSCVSIMGNRDEFPEKLWDVAEILEDFRDEKMTDEFVMSAALPETLLAWMEAQGMDISEPRAIMNFYSKKEPLPYNSRHLMKLIKEGEHRIRELGNVAPRKPSVRRVTPSPGW